MNHMLAEEANHGFGGLIDTARASPLVIKKHRRPILFVLSVEIYERPRALETERVAA